MPRLTTLRYAPKLSVSWDGKELKYYVHHDRYSQLSMRLLTPLVLEYLLFWTCFWGQKHSSYTAYDLAGASPQSLPASSTGIRKLISGESGKLRWRRRYNSRRHVISPLSYAANFDRLAGRPNLLRLRSGADSFFRLAHPAPRGNSSWAHSRHATLDGHLLGRHFFGEFDSLQPHGSGCAARVRRSPPSHLPDACAHLDIAIRNHPQNGYATSFDRRN